MTMRQSRPCADWGRDSNRYLTRNCYLFTLYLVVRVSVGVAMVTSGTAGTAYSPLHCTALHYTTLQTERASNRRLRRQPLISPESCSDTHLPHLPLAAVLVAARVAYYPRLRHAVCHGHSRVIVENVLGIASWKNTPLTAQDRFTPRVISGSCSALGPPRREKSVRPITQGLLRLAWEADSARSSWSTVAT